MKDCLGLAKEFQAKKKDDDNDDGAKDHRPPGDNNNTFQDHNKVVATIFGGLAAIENRRDRKVTARWVLVVNSDDANTNPSFSPGLRSLSLLVGPTSGWTSLTQGASPLLSMQLSRKYSSGKYSSTAEVL